MQRDLSMQASMHSQGKLFPSRTHVDIPEWREDFLDEVNVVIETGITVSMSEKFEMLFELLPEIEAPSFTYPHRVDQLASEECMLALWVAILTRIEQISVLHYKHLCYRILCALMDRHEFRLTNTEAESQDERHNSHLRLIKVYRQLVRDTFLYAAKLLQKDGNPPEILGFCCHAASVAFFIFPAIQAPLVDTLAWRYLDIKMSSPSHETLYSEFDIDLQALKYTRPDAELRQYLGDNANLFEWNQLSTPSDSRVLPDDDTWRVALSTDGLIFCYFVRKYVEHVRAVSSTPIIWEMIPGYTQLIQVFISLLYHSIVWLGKDKALQAKELNSSSPEQTTPKTSATESPVKSEARSEGVVDNQEEHKFVQKAIELVDQGMFEMNDRLSSEVLECATVLLCNSQLVRSFVKTALNTMQINSTEGVGKTLHCIAKWLLCCSKTPGLCEYMEATSLCSSSERLPLQSARLPTNLDMGLLREKIEVLLENEDSSIIVSALSFLYNHMDGMDVDSRKYLSNLLLQKNFFSFFLHWRFEVRCCFYHVLVYKLLRHDRRRLNLSTDRILLQAKRIGLLSKLDQSTDTQSPLRQLLENFKTSQSNKSSVEKEDTPEQVPGLDDHPQMILDVSIASKMDVYIQLLLSHDRKQQQQEYFPETLDIFIDIGLAEYGYIVASYYEYTAEVEQNEGRALKIYEAIEGPNLSSMLVLRSPYERQ